MLRVTVLMAILGTVVSEADPTLESISLGQPMKTYHVNIQPYRLDQDHSQDGNSVHGDMPEVMADRVTADSNSSGLGTIPTDGTESGDGGIGDESRQIERIPLGDHKTLLGLTLDFINPMKHMSGSVKGFGKAVRQRYIHPITQNIRDVMNRARYILRGPDPWWRPITSGIPVTGRVRQPIFLPVAAVSSMPTPPQQMEEFDNLRPMSILQPELKTPQTDDLNFKTQRPKPQVISLNIPTELINVPVLEINLKKNGDITMGPGNADRASNSIKSPTNFQTESHFPGTWQFNHMFPKELTTIDDITSPLIKQPVSNILESEKINSIQDVLRMQHATKPVSKISLENKLNSKKNNFNQNMNHIIIMPYDNYNNNDPVKTKKTLVKPSVSASVTDDVYYIDITLPENLSDFKRRNERHKRSLSYDGWNPVNLGDPMANDPTTAYQPPILERVHLGQTEGRPAMPLYPIKPENPTVLVVRSETPTNPQYHSVYGTERMDYYHVRPSHYESRMQAPVLSQLEETGMSNLIPAPRLGLSYSGTPESSELYDNPEDSYAQASFTSSVRVPAPLYLLGNNARRHSIFGLTDPVYSNSFRFPTEPLPLESPEPVPVTDMLGSSSDQIPISIGRPSHVYPFAPGPYEIDGPTANLNIYGTGATFGELVSNVDFLKTANRATDKNRQPTLQNLNSELEQKKEPEKIQEEIEEPETVALNEPEMEFETYTAEPEENDVYITENSKSEVLEIPSNDTYEEEQLSDDYYEELDSYNVAPDYLSEENYQEEYDMAVGDVVVQQVPAPAINSGESMSVDLATVSPTDLKPSNPWFLINTKPDKIEKKPSIASYIQSEITPFKNQVTYKPVNSILYKSDQKPINHSNPHLDEYLNSYKPSTSASSNLTAGSLSELLQIFKFTKVDEATEGNFDSFTDEPVTVPRGFRYTKQPDDETTTMTTTTTTSTTTPKPTTTRISLTASGFRYTAKPRFDRTSTTFKPIIGETQWHYVNNFNDAEIEGNSVDGYQFSDSQINSEVVKPDNKDAAEIGQGNESVPKATQPKRKSAKITWPNLQQRPSSSNIEEILHSITTTTSKPLYKIHQGHSKVKYYGINSLLKAPEVQMAEMIIVPSHQSSNKQLKPKKHSPVTATQSTIREAASTTAAATSTQQSEASFSETSTNAAVFTHPTTTEKSMSSDMTVVATTTTEATDSLTTEDSSDTFDKPQEQTTISSAVEPADVTMEKIHGNTQELVTDSPINVSEMEDILQPHELFLPLFQHSQLPPGHPMLRLQTPPPTLDELLGSLSHPGAFSHLFQSNQFQESSQGTPDRDHSHDSPFHSSLTKDELSLARPVFFTKRRPEFSFDDDDLSKPFEYLGQLRQLETDRLKPAQPQSQRMIPTTQTKRITEPTRDQSFLKTANRATDKNRQPTLQNLNSELEQKKEPEKIQEEIKNTKRITEPTRDQSWVPSIFTV